MDEPLDKQPNKSGQGAPEFTDIQYMKWLEDLAPFLKLGLTLNAAIDDAGLHKHRAALYEKARLNDWFSDKIKTMQSMPGRIANNILVKRLMQVEEKIKQGLPVSNDEMDDVHFIADKHRTAQPYFVNRTETKQVDDDEIGKVIDNLNDDDDLTERVTQPVVEANPPVQDKG